MNVTTSTARNFIPKRLYGMRKKSIKQKLKGSPINKKKFKYLRGQIMWELFKDKNEYNEKNIIGFLSFALMCVFGIVDLAMGIIGIELMVNDYIYNSFVWVTLGSFGIAGAEKVYKK